MAGPEERLQRFAEACIEPTGPIRGERWRCELCGFQVRGRERVLAHLAEAHGEEAEAWADRDMEHAKASFLSFLGAAASLGAGAFPLADGTLARLPAAGPPPPGLRESVGRELERALRFEDPCGAGAVEGALEELPREAQEAVFRLHQLSRGVGAYLAPLEGSDPNILAPFEPELLGTPMPPAPPAAAAAAPAAAAQAAAAAPRAEWGLACACGFTCGTPAALARHLARCHGDPAHRRAAA